MAGRPPCESYFAEVSFRRVEESRVTLELDKRHPVGSFGHGLEEAARDLLGVGQAQTMKSHETRVAADVGDQQQGSCRLVAHLVSGSQTPPKSKRGATPPRGVGGLRIRGWLADMYDDSLDRVVRVAAEVPDGVERLFVPGGVVRAAAQ